MRSSLFLAWRNVTHHRVRSLILIACLTLTFSLPLGSRLLMWDFEHRLTESAHSTPLVIGAAGSRFDLTMNALYFRGKPPRETTMQEVESVRESGYAVAIPLFVKFQADGFPVVGTSPDYFKFRDLSLEAGTFPQRLGDCIVGATVAHERGLQPGDTILTEPEVDFDFDSSFPLRMRVTGVLSSTGQSDDHGVFVDLPTTWLIAGIGHGHAGAPRGSGRNTGVETVDSPRHDASLIEYTEITDDNVGSFHFHGLESEFPLTAVLAIPNDERATTLLEGRHLRPDATTQAIRPGEVVAELLQFVVQLQLFFDGLFAVLAIVTVLLLTLVTTLTIRLRQREFQTMIHLGCRSTLILQLIVLEQAILLAAATSIAFVVAGTLAITTVDAGWLWQLL